MRILLAECHELFRDGVRTHLSKLTPDVLETLTVDEALSVAAEAEGIDIALLGRVETCGATAAKKMKDSFPRLRTIVITHDMTPDSVIATITAGAAAVLPRSVSGSDLLDAIRVVMSGGFYLSSGGTNILSLLAGARSNGSDNGRSGSAHGRLSPGEAQVAPLLKEGLSNKVIAQRLAIEEAAVKARLRSLFRKLGVVNRAQAVKVLVGGNEFSQELLS